MAGTAVSWQLHFDSSSRAPRCDHWLGYSESAMHIAAASAKRLCRGDPTSWSS